MRSFFSVFILACGWSVLSGAEVVPKSENTAMPPPSSSRVLFAPENLLAWCIVPFDNRQRTPAERVAMLKRLGFTQYAWDWRQEHLKDLAEEIQLSRENGIRLRAIWLWIERDVDRVGHLGEGNRAVLDEMKKAGLPVEFWVGFHSNFYEQLSEESRIRQAAEMMVYLREQAAESRSTVAMYNHGDWIGEPDNQIKIIRAAGEPTVGMVFNFHHAHAMIDAFPELLARMLPYLRTVNIDGMRPEGPKIIPLGQGTHELQMLRQLQQSGYKGPIGILGHVENADVEDILQMNLRGLRKLIADGEL
ncbi:MAG TPA: TIM barrel protein [Opitutus sp.]|nr:TIM barrel protein [Opitutus sp.]